MTLRLFLLTAISLLAATAAGAQGTQEAKKQINEIKKSSAYIYAEATAQTEAEAKDIAEEILYHDINEWVAKQKKLKKSANIVINNKRELWTSMMLPRGNMFRAFIFVKKSDIQPADNAEVIANNTAVNNTAAAGTSGTAAAGTVEAATAAGAEVKPATVDIVLPEAVKAIAACTEYADMAAKIKQLKAEGKLKSYARYASLENPDACFLVIYNTAGKVVALLTPGAQRVNVATKQPDSVANYSGCGAIGFEVMP